MRFQRSHHPRFWLTISLLLLVQLLHPTLSSPQWKSKRQIHADHDGTIFPKEGNRLKIPSEFPELEEFRSRNITAEILQNEQSGLLTGLCKVDNSPCPKHQTQSQYGLVTTIGKGLLEILKIGGMISAATCLSLSVTSIVTCGGLSSTSCQDYKDVKQSMNGLKELARDIIEDNAELRRWNASNLDILYKLTSIHEEIEGIVESNALLMDALGALHYNSTPTDMKPEEAKDEYDEILQKKKLEIDADIDQYIKSLDDRMARLTGTESIAFAVVAGVSLMVQMMPAFLRGVNRLQLNGIKISDLNVVMKTPSSGVRMAVNMKTGKQYFVEVSEGTVTKVLGKVKNGGMGGFFDLFASAKTKQKVNDFMAEEKLSMSRGRVSDAKGKLSINMRKDNLEKLADWTKDMDDLELNDFFKKVKGDKDGPDGFMSRAGNKPTSTDAGAAEVIPAAKGGIMSKLTTKFKSVGKFFGKVKSALSSVGKGITKTKLWQGMKKYGLDAIGALMSAASIGMCVHQVITTVNGASEMTQKIKDTKRNIDDSREDLNSAKNNIKNITNLQKELFKNLTMDAISMAGFFTNDTSNTKNQSSGLKKLQEEVSKGTPKFKNIEDKLKTPNLSQDGLRKHLGELKDLLLESRMSLGRIYQKVKMCIQISNSVRNKISVKTITTNLKASGFKVDDTFEIIKNIAWGFKDMDEYDNYPLNCLRRGVISNQLELDEFMAASGTVVIDEGTKRMIEIGVYYKSHVVEGPMSILNLLKDQQKTCGGHPCTKDDVLSVIAVLCKDDKEYDGFPLDPYRKKKPAC